MHPRFDFIIFKISKTPFCYIETVFFHLENNEKYKEKMDKSISQIRRIIFT